MPATVELAGEVFADPFDLYQAAPAGTKLSAEADAIIMVLEQILAAIRALKREPDPSLDDDGPDYWYLANNILQLSTMLGNVVWGDPGGIERVILSLEAQLKMLKKMLIELRKGAGSDPRKQAMVKYLENVLRIGTSAKQSWQDWYKNNTVKGGKR